MTQALYILAALFVGVTSAFQISMLAALGRSPRGPLEATWISMLASVIGATLAFNYRILKGDPPNVPAPFNNALMMLALCGAGLVALLISMRGIHWYYGLAGLAGFAYVIAASFLGQRIGIALFVSSVTAGTLLGSVVLDHFGAFGNAEQRLSFVRMAGVVALMAGVVLVRSGR
ncbi:MAG TPA: DMT family transporter [Dehalococcoidia bacterium]|nr:DMT family transporter [Dehalococcoidia bacterium]